MEVDDIGIAKKANIGYCTAFQAIEATQHRKIAPIGFSSWCDLF